MGEDSSPGLFVKFSSVPRPSKRTEYISRLPSRSEVNTIGGVPDRHASVEISKSASAAMQNPLPNDRSTI